MSMHFHHTKICRNSISTRIKLLSICLLSAGLFFTTANIDPANARHYFGERHQRDIVGGAIAGVIIGGIIGGRRGAAAGAVIGGIAGAVRRGERRRYRRWQDDRQWRRRR